MSKSTPNQLIVTAGDDGTLSPQSIQALTVVDIGAQIQAGLGVNVDDVKASEVFLVSIMPDDSGSIRMAGNSQVMRDGHNLTLDALLGSKQKDGILIHTRYLNGYVLNPYRALDQAVRMDAHNYNPDEGTPLYDNTVLFLATVLAKAQEFSDNGVPVRTATLIVSDGADMHSKVQKPATVKAIVQDMLKTESHIVAAMGVSDGSTDFYEVFSGRTRDEVKKARLNGTLDQLTPGPAGMGIWPRWVLTPGNTQSEIRKAFQVFSQSAVRASQGAGSFSKAMGGFGN